MPETYLYYRRGDEWVRVTADTYRQETKPADTAISGNSATAGFCATNYKIVVSYVDRDGYKYSTTGYSYGESIAFSRLEIGANGIGVRVFIKTGGREKTIGGNGGRGWDGTQVTSVVITREDGKPDNCGPPVTGGKCTTVFELAGATVLTLDSCPEVTNGKGCSDCCRELLPTLRSIQIK